MPFSIGGLFKKNNSDQNNQSDAQNNQTQETQQVITTQMTSGPVIAGGGGSYNGIGYAPGGMAPYNGIGYPSMPAMPHQQQPVAQTFVNQPLQMNAPQQGFQTNPMNNATGQQPVSGQPSHPNQPQNPGQPQPQQAGNKPPAPDAQPPAAPGSSMDMQKRVGMDILTRLTQRSTQALMIGVNKAKELHMRYVDTEHVLWGLLNDSSIYQLLNELKVAPKEVQDAVAKQLKVGNSPAAPQFSPRVKHALELGLTTARSLGYEFVSPEHILLALAQEGEGLAAQVMAKYNLTVDALNKKVTGKKEGVTDKKEDRGSTSEIEQFTNDLTQKAKMGKLDPVVARSAEIERVVHILSRRTKNNPVLIGEAGVGKTAIVEGLAQRIVKGDVPETLLNKRILELDLMSLVAGAKHRGEFEERLKNLIKQVKSSSGQIILFIDEIHNMVGAGGGGDGSMDAGNILKPSLARGELQVIGATTITEYRQHLEKDPALERRFQPVLVPEPTVDQAIEMLRALRDKYEAYHKVSIPDETIEAAVHLSQRYVGDRFLPDKAVDLVDEAASAIRLPAISLPEEIKSLQEHIKRSETEKTEAEKIGDTVRLATVSRELQDLQKQLEEKKQAYEQKKSTTTNVLSPDVIQEIVARWTNIPISKLTESESEKLMKLEDIIHKRMIDQEPAVLAVSEAVRRGRAGLKSSKRPIGSFVFMGPTGVGKTELAKALAEILFGSEDMMVRLDMTEYMEKHEVAKLIGAPPGYVGYEEGGQLTEAVRRHPYSVVLFDEIEKAHPDVFNILLQVLDDGRLTDNKGHVISFKNTIIICTSNLGSALIQKEMLGETSVAAGVKAIDSYVISPTGRAILTFGSRVWELDSKPQATTTSDNAAAVQNPQQTLQQMMVVQEVGNPAQPIAASPLQQNQPTVSAPNAQPPAITGWTTRTLAEYFAGSQVTNADVKDATQNLPEKGFDTHGISAEGEEMITSGGRFWLRKSTTSKEWMTDTLINYFKNHMVVNAYPDQPEQQLPTARLNTHTITSQGIQIITFGDRYWKRENSTTLDWVTETIADYLKDTIVVKPIEETKKQKEPAQQGNLTTSSSAAPVVASTFQPSAPAIGVEMDLDAAARIIRDPALQVPRKDWNVHLITPTGEEIVIVGDRYWKRASMTANEWMTDTLAHLFPTTAVLNASPDKKEELLPVGQMVEKAKEEGKEKDEAKYKEMSSKLMDELRTFFRPELVNRFDEVVVFRPLRREHMIQIVELQLKSVEKALEEQNIGYKATVSAKQELSRLGYDPIYGARPLRRTIQREVENPISTLLIEGKVKAGDTVTIDQDGNGFVFTVDHFAPKLNQMQAEEKSSEIVTKKFACMVCGSNFETIIVPQSTVLCGQCGTTNVQEVQTTSPSDASSTSQQPGAVIGQEQLQSQPQNAPNTDGQNAVGSINGQPVAEPQVPLMNGVPMMAPYNQQPGQASNQYPAYAGQPQFMQQPYGQAPAIDPSAQPLYYPQQMSPAMPPTDPSVKQPGYSQQAAQPQAGMDYNSYFNALNQQPQQPAAPTPQQPQPVQ